MKKNIFGSHSPTVLDTPPEHQVPNKVATDSSKAFFHITAAPSLNHREDFEVYKAFNI